MENEVVALILFVTGIALSLGLKISVWRSWYEEKTKKFKTYFNLGLNVAAGLGIIGVACTGVFDVPVTCNITGLGDIIVALGVLFGGNQLAYNIGAAGRKA